MLDAFIIDKLKKEREKKERQPYVPLELPVPEAVDQNDPAPPQPEINDDKKTDTDTTVPDDDKPRRGVVIIEIESRRQNDNPEVLSFS